MAVRLFITESDSICLTNAGESIRKFGDNVSRWLGKGYTKPEYCFVHEMDGKIDIGICFNEFEENTLEIMDFACEESAYSIAAKTLSECIKLAQKPQHSIVAYNLYDDSPQYKTIFGVFADACFSVRQLKKSFTFEGGAIPEGTERLSYRELAQVGEDAFVKAVMRVTEGTLDTDMARDVSEQGGMPAARSYVEGLKQIDLNDSWWRLAYYGGELAGLIIPQRLGEKVGAVNYIGVVPEMRGRGFVCELLRGCTRVLTEAGLATIHADIDAGNFPLEAALLRGGYRFNCEESVLARSL